MTESWPALDVVVQEKLEHKIGNLIYNQSRLDYCPARHSRTLWNEVFGDS